MAPPMTLGLVAIRAGLAWLVCVRILAVEHLLTGLLHWDERYLPPWAWATAC